MKVNFNSQINYKGVFKTRVPLSNGKNLKRQREEVKDYISYLKGLDKNVAYYNTMLTPPENNKNNLHYYNSEIIFRKEDIFVPDELDKKLEGMLSEAEIYYSKKSVNDFLGEEISLLNEKVSSGMELVFLDYYRFMQLKTRSNNLIPSRKTKNLNLEIAENLFKLKNSQIKADKKFRLPQIQLHKEFDKNTDMFHSLQDLVNFHKMAQDIKLDIIPCEVSNEDKKILEQLKIIQKPHLKY